MRSTSFPRPAVANHRAAPATPGPRRQSPGREGRRAQRADDPIAKLAAKEIKGCNRRAARPESSRHRSPSEKPSPRTDLIARGAQEGLTPRSRSEEGEPKTPTPPTPPEASRPSSNQVRPAQGRALARQRVPQRLAAAGRHAEPRDRDTRRCQRKWRAQLSLSELDAFSKRIEMLVSATGVDKHRESAFVVIRRPVQFGRLRSRNPPTSFPGRRRSLGPCHG